jgi:hypothetical protein
MQNVEWYPFDAIDLVPKRKLPRVVIQRFFEINPLGQIRYLDARQQKWRPAHTIEVENQKYLVAVIGFSSSVVVRVRIKVATLLGKYVKQSSSPPV